ncbi:MAG: outer membrane beta-barrel protein [Salinivirgaceae bacterium]|nr:outer membrane beta-barrel protein [Salinivirgaceae bacterium]
MLKAVIILIFNFYPVFMFCQSNYFIGGIFFNVNGIHLEGNNDIYWQNSNGRTLGAGGLSAGLSVKHYLNKKYYFKLEIRYVQKGSVYEYFNPYTTRSFEVLRLNYMEIPASIGYKFQVYKRTLFFESGFAYAKLFSSEKKINEYAILTNIENAESFKDTDISWFTCVKFPINKIENKILLGLRFSYSLFTIHEYDKLKNIVYGIQMDYKFNNK